MQHSIEKKNTPSKILIVEDHPIYRMGLVDLINNEEDMEVCDTAKDVKGALISMETVYPDLVIIDLTLKRSSGFELLRHIAKENKELPLLILSMHDEQIHAERCIREGAKGYINKRKQRAL